MNQKQEKETINRGFPKVMALQGSALIDKKRKNQENQICCCCSVGRGVQCRGSQHVQYIMATREREHFHLDCRS
ncbi:hypothetical protein I3842_12G018300 [Carya illinoinensis]|uniref:Uncharacterized protein n=1 Tax=Carya illinoinensis TaxID=32201 RepID=A0A922DFN2_CARIL|nr:hypothetical protein I3842_12G018300 [Carya illinoinensis]